MEKLLLENLADLQGFDAALKKGDAVDAIARRYFSGILFEPREAARTSAIDRLQEEIVRHFGDIVQPAAQQLGVRNARRILATLRKTTKPDVNDPLFRRRVLLNLDVRTDDRLRIVQAIVNDKANTLENRLTAYWLEPGVNSREKLEQLRRLHREMDQRRKAYEAKLKAFQEGAVKTRPAKPNLDYMAKFQGEVKQGVREQARRAGTDAETATFASQGYTNYAWITVNASEACPDCRKRQGVVGDMDFWERLGKPGSGKTVCGASCYCMLVPSATLTQNPQLSAGLNSRVHGVLTTKADAKRLDANRPGL